MINDGNLVSMNIRKTLEQICEKSYFPQFPADVLNVFYLCVFLTKHVCSFQLGTVNIVILSKFIVVDYYVDFY